ncbi:carboxylesterase family protein [Amycolatopsis sp. NPDC051716]|uniref:carboxylesterase/lipase family protein n=1 Tax=Amycolatopsis sp. NPDC051716 TaxID=3155804 RepID=UPI003431D374
MTADATQRSNAEPEIRTTAGTVRGRWESRLAAFLGIPYAAPPVGAARFAAPQPVSPWDGVRDAVAFGPPAPQDFAGFRNLGLGEGSPPRSTGDDWLTLNVWTPAPDRVAHLPVMVWIHGGAYKMGSGADLLANARIAREGNLVLVSLNYRLGVEGFAAIEGAPPNRGLLDQIAALEWVRDNIAAFGGDPDRVTVFGVSAGGSSVGTLMAMPAAAGLFRRAIAQSFGGPFLSPELATDITTAIAGRRGRRPTVADLSTLDPDDLALAGEETAATQRQYLDRWGPMAAHLTFFVPNVDGDVLPATPYQALAAGVGRDVELIAGHNRDEYRLFLFASGKLGAIDDREAARVLGVFGPGTDADKAYRAAFPDATAEQLWEWVQSDWLFRMPTLRLAQAHADGGGRTHFYELAWPAPGAGGLLGACHGLDQPLVFGDFESRFARMLLGGPTPSVETVELSARMRAAWISFATTGDPGWPAFDTDHRLTQVFDARPTVTAYPEESSRQLWERDVLAPLPLLP